MSSILVFSISLTYISLLSLGLMFLFIYFLNVVPLLRLVHVYKDVGRQVPVMIETLSAVAQTLYLFSQQKSPLRMGVITEAAVGGATCLCPVLTTHSK